MKILVCGGRNYNNRDLVFKTLDALPCTSIVHGAAKGADTLANEWALSRSIPIHSVPAQWDTHGKAAGPIRNKTMASMRPDLVIAFPGGKGTENMISIAASFNIPVSKIL